MKPINEDGTVTDTSKESVQEKSSSLFIDRILSPVGIGVILVFTIIFSLIAYLMANKSLRIPMLFSNIMKNKTPIQTPTQAPPPRAIPHGPKGFTVGQSDKAVPQFSKGTIDPYDPATNTIQTVTIAIKHTQPVIKVTAVLKTDHTISDPHAFTLTSGTPTDGVWTGSWKMTDSYLYTYVLELKAESANEFAINPIVLR